mgnify:CR=1 FL=1
MREIIAQTTDLSPAAIVAVRITHPDMIVWYEVQRRDQSITLAQAPTRGAILRHYRNAQQKNVHVSFRTADHGLATARIQWSADGGHTWHEPGEPAPAEVNQEWRQRMWAAYGN